MLLKVNFIFTDTSCLPKIKSTIVLLYNENMLYFPAILDHCHTCRLTSTKRNNLTF